MVYLCDNRLNVTIKSLIIREIQKGDLILKVCILLGEIGHTNNNYLMESGVSVNRNRMRI